MSTTAQAAQPAVEKLLQNNENQLYEELAIRLKGYAADPSIGGSFQPNLTTSAPTMGPADELRSFGQQFFSSINRQAYNLVCGSDPNSPFNNEHQQVVAAFNAGETAAAVALTAFLISTLAIAAPVATVVAAIIVKLFFNGALQATCQLWKANLPK